MKNHLVEIYLDSYNSEPFVTEMSDDASIDSNVCTWLRTRTGQNIDIETQLRVADVSHPRANSEQGSTRLRVQLVK
jgi:hypothetical protein